MAYEQGSASSMADFVSSLDSFLTTEGWTQEEAAGGSGIYAWSKNLMCISMRWNTTTPTHLCIYQALGYRRGVKAAAVNAGGTGYAVDDILTVAGGTRTTAATIRVTSVAAGVIDGVRMETAGSNYTVDPTTTANSVTGGSGSGATLDLTMSGTVGGNPGQYCGDSGSGLVTTTISQQEESRCLYGIADGPYTSYHFFTPNSGDDYFHGVVEYSAGLFRHFGWGMLDKKGDWEGGEYCYGHTHLANQSSMLSSAHTCLLDGISNGSIGNDEHRSGTIRLLGWPDQDAASMWGEIRSSTSYSVLLTDRDGESREMCPGGFRGGPWAAAFGWLRSSASNGFIPMYPIACTHARQTPAQVRLMGFMHDVRGVNIAAFTPKEEVVIGADTWVMFPCVRKSLVGGIEETGNQGIAYLKNV